MTNLIASAIFTVVFNCFFLLFFLSHRAIFVAVVVVVVTNFYLYRFIDVDSGNTIAIDVNEMME